jgi:hypothetical protein
MATGHLVMADNGGLPEIVTKPLSGFNIPSARPMTVDLPQPKAPTNATTSPGKISILILLTV